MDRKYIEENEIEIKYLRNQLTPDQLEEFEVYLMENPEALESMELHQGLIHGVENLENVSQESKISKLFSVFKPKFIGAYGLGAASMMAIMISFNAVQFTSQRLTSFSQVVYVNPTRSLSSSEGEAYTEIQFPDISFQKESKDELILAIDTGRFEIVKYDVFLIDHSLKIDNKISSVFSDNSGQAVVVLELAKLKPSNYILSLRDDRGIEQGKHEIRVRSDEDYPWPVK